MIENLEKITPERKTTFGGLEDLLSKLQALVLAEQIDARFAEKLAKKVGQEMEHASQAARGTPEFRKLEADLDALRLDIRQEKSIFLSEALAHLRQSDVSSEIRV